MEDTEVDVPNVTVMNDLIIIYKGEEMNENQRFETITEIKTSKEEFIRKLRYFKQRFYEISQQNEIYIHDIYPVEVFKTFISTLTTNKIFLNENNYLYLKELSTKYGYQELLSAVERFSQERPDIKNIVDKFSEKIEIDSDLIREMAKHLDICLQNENMLKYPIETINKIINSPERVLINYHLLFKFIKKILEKQKNNKNNQYDEEDKENTQILVSSLDYSQLSKEELKDVFENEEFTSVFNPVGSRELMISMMKENEHNIEKINSLEVQISELRNKFNKEQMNWDEEKRVSNEFQKKINALIEKHESSINTHEKELKAHKENLNDIEKKLVENENKIKEDHVMLEERKIKDDDINAIKQKLDDLQNYRDERINKSLKDIETFNEEQENKIKKSEEEIEKQQKLILQQSQKIKELEEKLDLFTNIFKLEGKIEVSVKSDGIIKGIITIKEDGAKLDKIHSKYILNMNNSANLGKSSYENGNSISKLKEEVVFKENSGTYYLHALLVDNFGREKELVSDAVTTKGIVLDYDFTGRVESATLEAGKYKLEVWGAEGGENGIFSSTPGKGGYSVGILTLKSKTKLFIHVGESPKTEKGGWNGGGSGSKGIFKFGAGGGGATDISLFGDEGSSNWDNINHLFSRIIVAGAGGGSAHNSFVKFYGGFGGGLSGQVNGEGSSNNAGTQTRAGKNKSNSIKQGFGVGGIGKDGDLSGGGAGWYGGCPGTWNGSGGSGGSGYVYSSSTASSYPDGCKLNSSFYLTNCRTEAGDAEIPNPRSLSNEKGHSGHGYARITPQ